MPEENQRDSFAFDEVQQFSCAGEKHLRIIVLGPGLSVQAELALHHDSVNGEKYGTGTRQVNEHGLVARAVAVRFQQREAGQQFRVAVNETIAKRGMIPVGARGCESRVPAACEMVMFALDDEFGCGERIVISGVVHIKMCGDHRADIRRPKPQSFEVLQDAFIFAARRRTGWPGKIGGQPTVNQDVLTVVRLDQVCGADQFERSVARQRQGGRG